MQEYFRAGGLLMWPLLACSIISLAIIIERCWFWRKICINSAARQAEAFLRKIAAGEHPEADGGNILAAMLGAGIAAGKHNCAKAMEIVALEAVSRMRKGMNILEAIIATAPMIGILGTVLGIISSFDVLGAAGPGDPKAIIAGIAQALITTAAGLSIAVLTIFPYSYFNNRIENAEDMLEIMATRLEVILGAQDEQDGKKCA